jgi:hypothetical protein
MGSERRKKELSPAALAQIDQMIAAARELKPETAWLHLELDGVVVLAVRIDQSENYDHIIEAFDHAP